MNSRTPLEEIEYQKLHYHDDKAPAIYAGSTLLIASATIVVVLRLVARRMSSASWQADDFSIVIALVFAFGMFVSIIMATNYGMGKHAQRVGKPNLPLFLKSLYVLEAIFPACTGTTKLSILLLYRRIFTTNDRRFKIALCTVGALLLGWAISGFFTTVFQCTPVHYMWDRISGTCIPLETSLVSLATINTLLNAAVLVLPIPMVWRLNMPKRQKIAVIGIFILAGLDILTSIIRNYMMSKVAFSLQDITWIDADGVMLAFVEPCVGIICACLPAMRSLFRNMPAFGSFTHSRRFKGSNNTYNSSSSWPSNSSDRRHSSFKSSFKRSSVLPNHRHEEFGQKPQYGWVPLAPLNDRFLTSEIHRGPQQRQQAVDGDHGLPLHGIKVELDLEWSVSHKV